jgi:hydroxypyruvate isomerase
MSLPELFQSAKRIGYAAVEAWFRDETFEEWAAAAKSAGLRIASICGHQSLKVGLNQRSEHERIIGELRQSIEIAAKHNIPGLICFSGNRNDGQSNEDAIAATTEGLKRAAPFAEAAGINLNMELLNSKINHPGYQCDHTAWGVEVCRRVNSPRVKLLYDIYHMQIMEGDVIRTIRENIQWIGHFHTAGNPERKDLDDEQELNYVGICRAIARSGYTGFVGHEFWPKGDLLAGLEAGFRVCNQD